MLFTQAALMLQALLLALLTWLGVVQVWHVIALSVVLGAASALEQPVRLAFVRDTVGSEDLTNAVALNSAVYNAARLLGPSLAGILVAWVGEAGCFLVNGFSYLAVIGVLLAIRTQRRPKVSGPIRPAQSVAEGLRYVWGSSELRGLMSIVAVSSFFALPYVALLPVFARDILAVGPQGLGLLMAGVGLGAIMGAMLVAGVSEGRRGKWLTVGNLLGPAFLLLFALTSSFEAGLVLVVLVGMGNAVRQTLANSLIQLRAAEGYQGRVMSIFNLLFNGMSRAGTLGVGALAQFWGAGPAVAAGAALSLIFGVAVVRYVPSVHKIP